MIAIILNKLQFEYDIYSLIKAFYEHEELKIFEVGQEDGSIYDLKINLWFLENKIQFFLRESKNEHEYENEISCSCLENRKVIKNKLKQVIYCSLSHILEKTLPWGTLTGIRPTKIVYQLMEKGWEKERVLNHIKELYFISDKKAQTTYDIAQREKMLLNTMQLKDGYSLYIGIPFCPTTCLYCSFTSYPIVAYKKKVQAYLNAMKKELLYIKDAFSHKTLETIYIGGGTPSTLEAKELEELLIFLGQHFECSTVKEFTVEAGRADSITKEKLMVLKKHKVNRISINPQTMKEETLKIIGRNHTVQQVIDAFYVAKEVGFDCINMDLILGLPGETIEDVTHTMEEICKLNPDSVTVHSLAIKRGSKLNDWIVKNGVIDIHNSEEIMDTVIRGVESMNMNPYYLYRQKNMAGNLENVGYAKKEKYGIYNVLIIEEKQSIVAVGAGSITKVVCDDGRIERCDAVKDIDLYIERIDEMIERKRNLFSKYAKEINLEK